MGFCLIDIHNFSLNTTGDLGTGEGLDALCLETGDTLGRLDEKGDLRVLGADDAGVADHVLFQEIDLSVLALVDRIQIDRSVEPFEAELIDLLLAHVQQIE